jgi:aerobic-type carbon monoxide dehydrogenase small subunit (CoxS/CutS family)
MQEKSKSGDISRRNFMKGLSSGVIGTTVVVKTLPALGADTKEATGIAPAEKVALALKVNGQVVQVMIEPQTTLAELLREHLDLTGTKIVCNHGDCGGCTVLLNGQAVYSCHLLALDAAGKEVVTIEGLLQGEKLHPIQEAFIEHDGLQCGFCTPGQILAAQALLLKHPKPGPDQIKEGMAGNLCRCAAYPNILKSVLAAAEKVNKL